MICPPPPRIGREVPHHQGPPWIEELRSGWHWRALRREGALPGGGARGGRRARRAAGGDGLARGPRAAACADFTFASSGGRRRGGRPGTIAAGQRVNPKARQRRGPDSTCHREADVERDRERKQAREQVPGKSCRASGQL